MQKNERTIPVTLLPPLSLSAFAPKQRAIVRARTFLVSELALSPMTKSQMKTDLSSPRLASGQSELERVDMLDKFGRL